MKHSENAPMNSGGERSRGDFLHRSISEALRRRLSYGGQVEANKLPSLRKLADELAVSTMTVRRALRTLEREGHVYRIAGVGTFSRRPTSRSSERRIAFVGSDLRSPFQMSVALGCQKAGQHRGWAMQLLDAQWDTGLESAGLQRLAEGTLDGALLLPPFSDPHTPEVLQSFQLSGLPMVLVDMAAQGLKADLVCSDHEEGAYKATKYLLDHGYRRVVFLTHPPVASSITARMAGYERALASAGILPPPEWKAWIDLPVHLAGYSEGRKWWGGCQAVLPLLRQLERPLAVLAVDSYVGWGVYEACRELGLRIPEDVSVIAFDDMEIAHAVSPPMTIISQRTDEIGRVALELLNERIEAGPQVTPGRKYLRQVLIEVDLVERGSVARACQ